MAPQYSFIGFLAFFICIWLGVTTLLARVSGWPRLAKQFRIPATAMAIDRIEEKRLWFMKYHVIHLHQDPVRILLRGSVARHVFDRYQHWHPAIHRNNATVR